ncbi:hypothetical protein ScPMuIL_006116 [Solemya velum]
MALIATKCLSAVDELDSKLSLEEPSTVLDALSSGKAQSKDIIFTKCDHAHVGSTCSLEVEKPLYIFPACCYNRELVHAMENTLEHETTQKVADLSDTFYKTPTHNSDRKSRVKKLDKARDELESLKNNASQSSEAQWNRDLAKQERKISLRVSKVQITKGNYLDSLDEEFANRPPFVKMVLSGKEWLEDIE